jgi:membrane carboxypeptidase/penicillin-binding protein
MSQGRIGRSTRRYPGTLRRSTHFSSSRYGHRGRGLPPHLMPGVSRQKKEEGVFSRRNFLLGGVAVFFVTLLSFLSITVVSAVSGAMGTVSAYRKVNRDLPDAARIAVNTFQTTRIFDRKGTLLQEVDNPDYGWRTFIPMGQMAETFINATVSAEDSTFWTNHGVEPFAILRGGFIIASGSGSSGGSTITQQLVRAVFPEQISAMDMSLTRKFREALAAVALAQEYSKEDIFTMYVNQIYYGARSYGVEAATNTYFSKHASTP